MIAHRNTFTVIRRFHGNSAMNKQRGAVAVIVALSMVGLLAFAGLALDLGKLFVTKTELQNSADACALSASRELTGANTNQLELAEAAGIAAGISNLVMFQGEPVAVGSGNITFSETLNGGYVGKDGAADPLAMRYVRCTVGKTGIVNWFMQVLGVGSQQVSATAVATMAQGQTLAAFPMAICSAQIAAISRGEWFDPTIKETGNILWADFSGNGAQDLKTAASGNGATNLPVVGTTGVEVGDPGAKEAVFTALNTRFGIYGSSYKDYTDGVPDHTGVSYTGKSWPQCNHAFDDFVKRREDNTPYPGLKDDGLNAGNGSTEETHRDEGADRRLIIVPVIDCCSLGVPGPGSTTAPILKWACVLLLHPDPINSKPNDDASCPGVTAAEACPATVADNKMNFWLNFASKLTFIQSAHAAAGGNSGGGGGNSGGGGGNSGGGGGNSKFFYLEYLGLIDDPDSPCGVAGMTGGSDSGGARVPTLVQ